MSTTPPGMTVNRTDVSLGAISRDNASIEDPVIMQKYEFTPGTHAQPDFGSFEVAISSLTNYVTYLNSIGTPPPTTEPIVASIQYLKWVRDSLPAQIGKVVTNLVVQAMKNR